MDILFTTPKLARLCDDAKTARRALGPEGATKLRRRLDDLAAAQTLDLMKVLPGRLHELKGDLGGHFALDLHQGWRLVLKPSPDPAPRLPDGGIDSKVVTSVTITAIEDYHGG